MGDSKSDPDMEVRHSGELDVDVRGKVGVDAKRDDTGFHEPYSHFARSLRIWLISYGIGGPVLLLNQDRAWNALASVGYTNWIAGLFLMGVAIQVLGALLYKTVMWYLYLGELDKSKRHTLLYRWSDALSECYWLEALLDLLTILLFCGATILTVMAIGG